MRGAQTTVDAFVVRSMEYREKDRIVSLITPSHGRVDAVARGAKTSARRFGGHLELGHRIEAVVALSSSGLHSLRSAEAKQVWSSLQTDFTATMAQQYVCELALRTSAEGEADEPAFRWIGASFDILEQCLGGLRAWPIALWAIERSYLRVRGLYPETSQCAECGKALGVGVSAILHLPELWPLCRACAETGASLREQWQSVTYFDPRAESRMEHVGAWRRAYRVALSHALGSAPRTAAMLDASLAQGNR